MAAARWLTFIWFPGTERADLLSDDDWQRVEVELVANPLAGVAVRGLGGLRKLRVAVAGRGKRGGARTIYFYAASAGEVYFLLTYAKNEQPELTTDQRRVLRSLAETLRNGGD